MGAACCCLRNEYEDLTAQNASVYGNCIVLRLFLENFVHMGGEQRVLTPSSPAAVSGIPMGSLDNSLVDMFRPPPQPLPYDADPRSLSLQYDGHVSRMEKGSSHSYEEAVPFTTSEVDEQPEHMNIKNKWTQVAYHDPNDHYLKSSMKLSDIKSEGFSHIYTSSEDEDICPTCLDEYTLEDPKIITECGHHYHLGCIYEWMERSDKCPVCGKIMAFHEAS